MGGVFTYMCSLNYPSFVYQWLCPHNVGRHPRLSSENVGGISKLASDRSKLPRSSAELWRVFARSPLKTSRNHGSVTNWVLQPWIQHEESQLCSQTPWILRRGRSNPLNVFEVVLDTRGIDHFAWSIPSQCKNSFATIIIHQACLQRTIPHHLWNVFAVPLRGVESLEQMLETSMMSLT